MKNFLIINILIQLSISGYSQSFATVGSKWVYCYAVNALGGSLGRDTLVLESVAEAQFDGLPCKKIQITHCYSFGNFGGGLVYNFMICQDQKKIYYKEADSLYLLYNFGAMPGDTLHIRYPLLMDTFNQIATDPNFYQNPSSLYFDLNVLDTLTVEVSGHHFRGQILEQIPIIDSEFNSSWSNGLFIENIGSTLGWLLPRAIHALQEEQIPFDLISYSSPIDNIYYYSPENLCIISSTNTVNDKKSPCVFPSIFDDFLTIIVPRETSNAIFKLYDQFGRLILVKNKLLETNEIETNRISKGLYFWEIIDNNKIIQKGKVLKF
jgi:hypothetical protein